MKKEQSGKVAGISILLFVLIGAMAVLSYSLYRRNAQLEDRVQQLDEVNAILKQDTSVRHLKDILAADQMVFKGMYNQALKAYEDLEHYDEGESDSLVAYRIGYVRKLLRNERGLVKNESDSIQLLPETDSVAVLKSVNDSVRTYHRKTTDSLKVRIAELNRKIRDRNRVLEQKEQLEVKIFQNAEGSTIHYIGEIRKDMANGQGTGMWEASGGVYKGQWADNQRHGYGIYTWSDGVRYEGNFVLDKREGKGTYTWLSGERYEGNWKNNKRHGNGVLFDKDGNISFKGNWKDDKPDGK